jgi:hypothetical protein
MIDHTPSDPDAMQLSLDEFVRDVLPEVKLALGELIDRENARALPGKYARLLPETLLVATLRPDAAAAITPIAADLEQELSDSCSRHGSLYDRVYRVQLRRSGDGDAPLFAVSAHAGHDLAPDADAGSGAPVRSPEPPAGPGSAPAVPLPGGTPYASLPLADPDATRAEGMDTGSGWNPGRWLLVVEDDAGEEREVFRLVEPFTTVGRHSDDPLLRVTIALSEVPHLSRRQLALFWDGEEPRPGFRVFNLGLNPLHLGERSLPGARVGRGALRLDELDASHSARIEEDEPVRIGDQGPVLRLREIPAPDDDPDATRFG